MAAAQKKPARPAAKLSGRQLAKQLGVTEGAVRQMRRKGQITPAARARGRQRADQYDLEQTRRQRAANVQPFVPPGQGDDTMVQLSKAEKAEKIKRLRLDNAITRAEYVPVAPVRAMLSDLAINVKNALSRMVLELADEIAPESPADFKARAQPYVDRALLAISEGIKTLPANGGPAAGG